eukprot:1436005-Prymnesium_polylepis.1
MRAGGVERARAKGTGSGGSDGRRRWVGGRRVSHLGAVQQLVADSLDGRRLLLGRLRVAGVLDANETHTGAGTHEAARRGRRRRRRQPDRAAARASVRQQAGGGAVRCGEGAAARGRRGVLLWAARCVAVGAECSVVQCRAVRWGAVQCSAVQCRAVGYWARKGSRELRDEGAEGGVHP